MHQIQREQTHALLRDRHIDQAVFARPESVTWLTGFAVPVQTGPNLFAASYPLVWYDGGQFTLIVVDSYADLAAPFAKEADGLLVTYPGNTVDRPIAGGANLLAAFSALPDNNSSRLHIGVEREFVSDLITEQLREHAVVAIDHWLEPLRMIKTPEELEKLRRNFGLTDIGHVAARAATVAGAREIDVWIAAHSAIQAAAGLPVPLGNDCIMGRRSWNVGGWPGDLELKAHDSLLVDLCVILDGYWSDSCATYYVGERTDQQDKMHQMIEQALDFAAGLIRPGVVAKDIDQQTRAYIAGAGYSVYPHHTGHAVGVSGHEAPRIVPYNDEVLQAGMVIMLEPGTYFPGVTGVRLEDGFLVTATGAEKMTHHDKS